MDVRRFEAFSMNDAIKLVKKELGKDAVILSTREKETFAIEGGKAIKLVEVFATSASQMTQNQSPQIKDSAKPSPAMTTSPLMRRASVLSQSEAQFAKSVKFPTVDDPKRLAEQPTIVTGSSEFKYNRANPPEKTAARQLTSEERPANPGLAALNQIQSEVTKLRQELETLPQVNVADQMQEIKVLLHDLMRQKAEKSEPNVHEYVTDIGVRLRAAGVLEVIIVDTLQEINSSAVPKGADGLNLTGQKLKEWYLSVAIRSLFKKISVTGTWKLEENKQHLICLVGPTGVGKTTSLAKIAARLKLVEGKSVAFATLDTFRIGGAEQLKVYSQILNCPFQEISDPSEIETFVQRHYNTDVLLIDTAGISSRNSQCMAILKEIEKLPLPISNHLVLSATMKQRDLEETIKRYKQVGINSLIFTKLDESWSYGEILNCACLSRVPLSYFATGQKVPEDIEIATKERIIERIFRL